MVSGTLFVLRRLAHLVQFLGRQPAAVGVAARQHLLGHLTVALGAGELRDGIAVPCQLQPLEAVDDRRHGLRVVALAVGILDAQ